jgi:hypothetical protein
MVRGLNRNLNLQTSFFDKDLPKYPDYLSSALRQNIIGPMENLKNKKPPWFVDPPEVF